MKMGHINMVFGMSKEKTLLERKEELIVKLDIYSRTDRVAYDRVLMELFEVENEIRDLNGRG
jgi:hypothetical protein